LDSGGKSVAIDLDNIVRELSCRRMVVEPSINRAEFAIDIAADLHPLEQRVSRRVAEQIRMLEGDRLSRRHLAAGGRAVVFEHSNERLAQHFKIVLGEAGSLSELGGNKAVRAIETVWDNVLAPHRAVVGALVALFVAFYPLPLLGFVRGSHTGNRD